MYVYIYIYIYIPGGICTSLDSEIPKVRVATYKKYRGGEGGGREYRGVYVHRVAG